MEQDTQEPISTKVFVIRVISKVRELIVEWHVAKFEFYLPDGIIILFISGSLLGMEFLLIVTSTRYNTTLKNEETKCRSTWKNEIDDSDIEMPSILGRDKKIHRWVGPLTRCSTDILRVKQNTTKR